MGKFKGCLLASDIDGTLLSNGELPERNLKAIEYFIAEGGSFALATGRTAGSVSMVTRVIKNIGPSITGNGSVIYDFSRGEINHSISLGDYAKRILAEIKKDYPALGVEVHSGERVFLLTRSDETDAHEEYEEIDVIPIDIQGVLKEACNKFLIALESEPQRKAFMAYLERFKTDDCDFDFIPTTAKIYGRDRYYCEVVPKGCNKAAALIRLKGILNIPKGGCYAIGDYYNDLEMLRAADTSAVTPQAPQELKEIANTVTGSVENGAVADFIDYIEKQLERNWNMDAATKKELEKIACRVRMGIIEGVHAAKAGHPGGSLSCADILTYLYFKEMNIDPTNPDCKNRDRFVLSKGHAAPALYAVLAERGFFSTEELKHLRQIGYMLQGHPDMKGIPGVDMSTGSLGQGISAACGMALSAKHFGDSFKVYSVLGDGEIEEGQVWEAAMFAANKGLTNLTAFVDYNNLQIDGTIEEVNSAMPMDKKFEAFNWATMHIDGHDFEQIEEALKKAAEIDKPVAIIAHTVKGKGVSYMENAVNWHGAAPNDELAAQAMEELKAAYAEMQ